MGLQRRKCVKTRAAVAIMALTLPSCGKVTIHCDTRNECQERASEACGGPDYVEWRSRGEIDASGKSSVTFTYECKKGEQQ